MKKSLVLLIVTAVLLVSFPFVASAAESKDLSVNYTNLCDGMTVPAEDGKAEGALPDGTEFSAENLPDGSAQLRVYPVQSEEKDVHTWIDGHMPEEQTALQTYHVTVVDADGNLLSNQGAKITVEAPKKGAPFTVYSLDAQGNLTPLSALHQSGVLTFTANGATYYVIAVAAENPKTSDALWGGAMILAAAALVCGLVLSRKKEF